MKRRRGYVNLTTESLHQRLERYIERVTESGCWIWLGSVHENGYGVMSFANERARVHRLAYELYRGPIPLGLVLDHKCRVRCCVNPDHLELVTIGENVLRGIGPTAKNAVKTHCKRGHELAGDNLVMVKTGRSCLTCRRFHSRLYRQRHKASPTFEARQG
jgi:hypothetical protein